jgi:hypothetical protein
MKDRPFYIAWIGANALAEGVGLGTTLVIGWRLAPSLDQLSGVASTLTAALLAVVLGTFLEGIVVGVAQEVVLRKRIARLHSWFWTTATAIGAALAWLLGTVPSTVMALTASESRPNL